MADGRLFLAFRSPAEIWTVALRLSVPGVQIRSPAKIEQLRYYWRLGSRSPVEIWTVALRSSVPGVQISGGNGDCCYVQGGAVAPPRAHGGRQRGGGQQQQRQRIRLTQGK